MLHRLTRRPVRGQAAALAARVRRALAGGGDDAGRELRRAGARGCLTACSARGRRRGGGRPTRRGCGRCSTPRRRSRGRAGCRTRSRTRSRPRPRERSTPRELGRARRGERQPGRAARGGAARASPGAARCTAARRARTSSTRRRCSSRATRCEPLREDLGGGRGRGRAARRASTARRRSIGRTLLQQALPTTFGLKAAGWMRGARRGRGAAARRSGPRRSSAGRPARSTALGPDVLARFAASSGSTSRCCRGTPSARRIAALAGALGIACGRDRQGGRRRRAARADRGRRGRARPRPAARRRCRTSATRSRRSPRAPARARRPGSSRRCSPSMEQEHERAAGAWHAEWAPLRALLVAHGLRRGVAARRASRASRSTPSGCAPTSASRATEAQRSRRRRRARRPRAAPRARSRSTGDPWPARTLRATAPTLA